MEHLYLAAPRVPGIEDLEEVARGGAGVVYRGRQTGLDRDVAVKVLLASGAPEEAARRWRREVTALARVSNHPNIVDVYDGGFTEDGRPYLVMPFVPDGSLEQRVRASGGLPAEDVAAIGLKLASALAAAHAGGVLHRDVKPANVLLSPYGEPQLSDFGIAQLADATATLTAGVRATVAYAAPEVLSGQPASEASDVYSLGATLFACLAGRAPYASQDGESFLSLAMRVVAEPPLDLRGFDVDPTVAGVVERAMAKDPAARLPTADALGAALAAAAQQTDQGAPGGAAGAPTVVVPATQVGPVAALSIGPTTPPAPMPPVPSTAGAERRPLAVLAAVVLAAVVAFVAFAALGDEDDDLAGPSPSTTAEPETTTSSPATDAPTTAPPDTVASTPPDGDLASVATAYLAALQRGDVEEAYAMTSPGFQESQPFDGFARFWRSFATIEVDGEPQVDERRGRVTVDLVLDGSRERYRLELVPGDQGGFLVDGPRPR